MASSSVAATPLLYSCIAYKSTILCEHTSSAASATSGLASVVLPKINHSESEKRTYVHGDNHIHYISDATTSTESPSAAGVTYMVVATANLGRRIPFGYLVEIKNRFLAKFPPDSTDFSSLPAYGAAAFNSELRKLMVDFGSSKAGQEDAFRNVQREIDDVRGIMTENIERVLERGERIDLLVDKTDKLGGNARDFRVRSRVLRRKMWWKNIRLWALLVVVCVFLIYLLVGFGCGLPGQSYVTRKVVRELMCSKHGRDAYTTDLPLACLCGLINLEYFLALLRCVLADVSLVLELQCHTARSTRSHAMGAMKAASMIVNSWLRTKEWLRPASCVSRFSILPCACEITEILSINDMVLLQTSPDGRSLNASLLLPLPLNFSKIHLTSFDLLYEPLLPITYSLHHHLHSTLSTAHSLILFFTTSL